MCKGNPSRNFGWLDIEFNSLACLLYCLFWFSLWILSLPLAFKAMVVWVAYHNSLIDSQDFCKRIPFFLELILLYEYQSTQKAGEIELYYYWISKEERCCQSLHILPFIGHSLVILFIYLSSYLFIYLLAICLFIYLLTLLPGFIIQDTVAPCMICTLKLSLLFMLNLEPNWLLDRFLRTSSGAHPALLLNCIVKNKTQNW